MRLIAYVRVSTAEQAETGHSLGQQPTRIAAWAELHGHSIVRVLTDAGVSAGKPLAQRRAGKDLLDALAAGEADGVVALRLDRLFRNARDGLSFAEDFAIRHGVSLHTVDGCVDTSTPQGWLMLAISLVTAQYERLMTSQRNRDTARALREASRPYGPIPFGCVSIDEGGTSALRRTAQAWRVREMIVGWYRDGVVLHNGRRQRASLRTLRDMLQEQRIVSPTGRRIWALDTLRTLIKTHDSLTHLPLLDEHGTPSPAPLPVTEVSPDGHD